MIFLSIPIAIILSAALSFAITKLFLDRKFEKIKESEMKRHTALVSAASHELRTPLSNVLGLVSNLQSEFAQLSPRGQETFQQLNNSSGSLHKILIDVLEIFDLSNETVEISKSIFNVPTVVKDTIDGVKRRLKEKQSDIKFSFSSQDDIWVDADPVRFKQCLDTLLSQSAHQTRNGTISIDISRQSKGRNGNFLLKVIVADDSSGMDQYKADKYFVPEHYEMNPALRGRPSAMLAINLAKGVAELMGGSITSISKVGGGVTFKWLMQAQEADAISQPARKTDSEVQMHHGIKTISIKDRPTIRSGTPESPRDLRQQLRRKSDRIARRVDRRHAGPHFQIQGP